MRTHFFGILPVSASLSLAFVAGFPCYSFGQTPQAIPSPPLSSSAAIFLNVTLDVPCGGPPFTACAEFLNGPKNKVAGNRITAPPGVADTGLLAHLDDMIQGKINHLYQGVDVDLLADGAKVTGTYFTTPVCDLMAGEETQPSPLHLGFVKKAGLKVQDCGQYRLMTRSGFDFNPPYGTRERAYFQGGKIAALKAFQDQVVQEILKGKLQITGASMIPAGYKDFLKANNGDLDTVKQVQESAAIEECKTQTWDHPEDLQKAEVRVNHRSSVCELLAARGNIEYAFLYAAYEEIIQRAWKYFSNNSNSILSKLKKATEGHCQDVAAQVPKKHDHFGNSFANRDGQVDAYSDCLSKHYTEYALPVFKEYFDINNGLYKGNSGDQK